MDTLPTGAAVQHGNVTLRNSVANGAGGQVLQIDQSSQRAIIQWNTFDIGSASEVRFNQPNAGASVLNRILDANPSVIQGKLNANGQVYLLNRNGILFDRGSQVNVHSLMATSLDIDDELYKRLGLAAGNGTPALSAAPGSAPGGVVLKGVIQTQAGGAVYVFAPTVVNEGIIRAPDGQVILAAGNVAYLYENPVSTDVSIRGLLVEIKAADGDVSLTSLVTNAGTIQADRGNVTLAGLAVNQNGKISATSAALQNGSIWLLANARDESGGVGRTGHVSLARGSETSAALDTQDTTALAEDQSYTPYRSVIRIEGKSIDHGGIIRAPGGTVSMTALDAENPAASDTSRIHLDTGSIIDVSGNWVDLALEKAFLTVKLTSNELKDAPIQKGGFLQGQSVTLDLRRGTPLFDFSGYAGSVKRGVGEKAAVGGDIRIESRNGDLIQRRDALLDVSGGGYRYAAGAVETTRFTSNGRSVDIAAASPDVIYDGTQNLYVQRYNKWGVTEQFTRTGGARALAEAASVEGKAAGSILVNAVGGAVLDGILRGGAVAGRHQLEAGKLPSAGRFVGGDASVLGTTNLDFKVRNVNFVAGELLAASVSAFNGNSLSSLPDALRGHLNVPRSLFATGSARADGGYTIEGFADITLLANDQIHVGSDLHLEMPVGGSLTMVARDLRVDGTITARAGSVDLRALRTVSTAGDNPVLRLASSSRVDTRGLWINDNAAAASRPVLPRLIHGGNAKLTGFDTVLESGSIVDVSGGGSLSASRSLTRGNGGLLRVSAGQGAAAGDIFLNVLEGDLRGDALGRGGSLEIVSGRVRIGSDDIAGPGELLLDPARFSAGGFASYSVDGRFSLSIADGARIEPRVRTRALNRTAADSAPSGSDLASFSAMQDPPLFQRGAANVSLSSSDLLVGTLDMGEGALISVDPKGKVALAARAGMTLRGRIEAPAGEIRLSMDGGENNGQLPDGTLRLTNSSALIVSGTFVEMPSALGLSQGEVMGGGTVRISTYKNRLVAESGSLIDVSGASQLLDLLVAGARGFQRQHVHGDSGSVVISSTQGAILQGDLHAQAIPGAAGGSFSLDLRRHNDTLLSDSTHRIVIGSETPGGGDIEAFVPLARLAASGFDKVSLRSADALDFRGNLDVSLSRALQLDAREMRAASGINVRLNAPRVALGGSGKVADPLALPVSVLTSPGDAVLEVNAGGGGEGVLDLFGDTTLSGFAQVRLGAEGDIRMTGRAVDADAADGLSRATRISGSFTTDAARVELSAQRLYPTSGSAFEVLQHSVTDDGAGVVSARVPGGELLIRGNGNDPSPVLSAAGSLRISADRIEHAGDIRAPLGRIELSAGTQLRMADASRTSVSADGSLIPFGGTLAGREWYFNGVPVTGLNAKRINLTGDTIDVERGAVLNIAGGGDILGVEFVPGPGGSRDALLKDNTFAILPWLGAAFSPVDTHLAGVSGHAAERGDYDTVYLSGGGGLPEGRYALLPGYYALLPGAFVVRPLGEASYRDLQPGSVSRLASGAIVVAGYRAVAGTPIRESRWSGFAVSSGEQVQRESEYRISNADALARLAVASANATSHAPRDAGQLVLGAGERLAFQGTVQALPADGGRIAEIDIAATRIAITSTAGQSVPSGYLVLDAPRLSSFGASLLIGGTRDRARTGTRVTVTAGDIIVANDSSAPLSAPELILAARDNLAVADGARLIATGIASVTPGDLSVTNAAGGSDGALLRLALGQQVGLRREAPARLTGNLTLSRSAQLSSPGSLLLDATGTTHLQASTPAAAGFKQFDLASRGQIAFGAGNIKVGYTGAPDGSLILTPDQLASLSDLRQVRLRSYTALDLYGGVTLGGASFDELEIDSARISGWNNGAPAEATLQAARVILVNRGQAPDPTAAAPDGTASLSIVGDEVRLGEGDKVISGFDAVNLRAGQQIVFQGKGDLALAAAARLESGRVTSEGAATQQVRAVGSDGRIYALAIASNGNGAAYTTVDGLGAALSFAGKGITVSGRVDAAGGRISLEALGTATADQILLEAGGALNAGAARKQFGTTEVYANAGSVTLSSAGGGVVTRAGSRIDLSGLQEGGDAGTLRILAQATNASVRLDGEILASAGSGTQGRFQLDAGRVDNLQALNARLNQGGFTAARDIRLRQGDILIAGENALLQLPAEQWVARDITLAADDGSIRVLGRIDASSAQGGGNVRLFASGDVIIGAGGAVLARGTSTQSSHSHGGEVELYSQDGSVRFDTGALIDVSAGARGDAGQVVFSAPRAPANDQVNAVLSGTLRAQAGPQGRAPRVFIEGRRRYDRDVVDAGVSANFDASSNPIWGEYDAFMAAASGLSHGLRNSDGGAFTGALYRAGIDLQSDPDLTLSAPWNLSDPQWMRNAQAGRLSLRSARNLLIADSLGLANDNDVGASSWALRLVGGADFAAANPMATLNLTAADMGDVLLNTAVSRVRASDGAVEIAAGRDFALGSESAVVMTTGVTDGDARFTRDGGDISIAAGRDAVGRDSPQLVNTWLRRTTVQQAFSFATLNGTAGEWWSARALFNHNVGALGGGSVRIDAGRDVHRISAMIPSSGQLTQDIGEAPTLTVRGAGTLDINAGRDVLGGEYLLGTGTGRITAAEGIGTTAARVALYLQGEHEDDVLRGARFDLRARGDIHLQNVSNPTILVSPTVAGVSQSDLGFGGGRSAFFTYAGNSELRLQAVLGDVNVAGTAVPKGALGTNWTHVAPPRYSIVSLSGNVRSANVQEKIVLYPSEKGTLQVLAAGDITGLNVEAADVSPSELPTWSAIQGRVQTQPLTSAHIPLEVVGNARPRRVDGAPDVGIRYRVVTESGDIRNARFYFPSVSEVRARRDIVNLQLLAQNLRAEDQSVVAAGRDLRYIATNSPNDTPSGFGAYALGIGGPGSFMVRAGRDLDLGTELGIVARGDGDNASLRTSQSARLLVAAGIQRDVRSDQADQLFAELLAAGQRGDKARADLAVGDLFTAGTVGAGNLSMVFSKIKTEGGSGIDILVPNGGVEAGLTTSQQSREIGVITTLGGGIRSYLSGDFDINQSKLLTMQGGDILIYTRLGSIDAGRGARDSRSTQPPRRTKDANGITVFVPPIDAAGSGIRTLTSDPDGPGPLAQPAPGDVFLFAPSGVINAGEAGIASAGNIVVVAVQVLNAVNISAGGSSTGVPTAPTTTVAATLASSGAGTSTASRGAEDMTRSAGADEQKRNALADSFRPTFINVEVLGFGEP